MSQFPRDEFGEEFDPDLAVMGADGSRREKGRVLAFVLGAVFGAICTFATLIALAIRDGY